MISYILKQFGRMSYNRLSEYLFKKVYVNNLISPCVFLKKSKTRLRIIAIYVDDLNLIWTPEKLTKIKKEFKIKDLGKTRYCLNLQIELYSNGILVHQSTYVEKVLKWFVGLGFGHPIGLTRPDLINGRNKGSSFWKF